jgi:hypothetical protein
LSSRIAGRAFKFVAVLKGVAKVACCVAGFAVVVALAGCTAHTNVPRPTATATGSATTRALTADTPLDKGDAYLACTNWVLGNALGHDTSDPRFVDFAHAYIVKRTDGLFNVYVEYTDANPKVTMHLGAAQCILGGTIGSPDYGAWGSIARLPVAQRDPNQAIQ